MVRLLVVKSKTINKQINNNPEECIKSLKVKIWKARTLIGCHLQRGVSTHSHWSFSLNQALDTFCDFFSPKRQCSMILRTILSFLYRSILEDNEKGSRQWQHQRWLKTKYWRDVVTRRREPPLSLRAELFLYPLMQTPNRSFCMPRQGQRKAFALSIPFHWFGKLQCKLPAIRFL